MAERDVRQRLHRLAGNFRWVWDQPAQRLFRSLDTQLWDACTDPFAVIAAATEQRLTELAADAGFVRALEEAEDDLEEYLRTRPAEATVAYFCMEHGIAPALRVYAGGLGMLAGCIEKTASDLGVPMVAVGLAYRSWFRQRLRYGWQHEEWQPADPAAEGLTPCPHARVGVDLAGEWTWVRVWRARVGRLDLYLLDTDDEDNAPHLRGITDRLYGGDREHRLRQEIVLGVGGVRALEALGHRPEVFHANEGHAGFMGLERIGRLMSLGTPFEQAVRAVRESTVFTTHTAVPAGFDLFDPELIRRYFGGWAALLDVPFETVLDLGRFPGEHGDAPFNMAVLCARLAGQVNAVSRLHREITERTVLGGLWPGRAAPIQCVTNGVHPRTWTPARMSELFERYVGPGWDYADADAWDGVWRIPDAHLWRARRDLRADMVEAVRRYLPRALREQGWGEDVDWAGRVLDPEALTIVVARRAAEYKETDLLFSQPQRLAALTGDPARPVQLIVSGLAHPSDDGGKERIRRIAEYSAQPDVRARVVYLPGYDMHLARTLLHGADIWLNHPRRGDEACGTSFMKSVFAGGQILTTADGGADELIVHGDNGWLIGDRGFDAPRDRVADDAFALIEREIVPLFLDRDAEGVPTRWVHGIKRSLSSLAWQVGSFPMLDAYRRMYRRASRHASPLQHATPTHHATVPAPRREPSLTLED